MTRTQTALLRFSAALGVEFAAKETAGAAVRAAREAGEPVARGPFAALELAVAASKDAEREYARALTAAAEERLCNLARDEQEG